MNLDPKGLLRSSKVALGLAALAATLATAEPAAAQRRAVGDVWEVTASRAGDRGGASVTVGDRGTSFRASFGQRSRGGRYVTRYERVWVPGFQRQVWVPPVYEWRCGPFGNRIRVCVRAGFYRTECVPGRYESRPVQVWVPHRDQSVRRDRVTHVGRRYRR
ncbi:MAG: hypothetical protein AAGA20_12305 [Planctomycetota bacterium]